MILLQNPRDMIDKEKYKNTRKIKHYYIFQQYDSVKFSIKLYNYFRNI